MSGDLKIDSRAFQKALKSFEANSKKSSRTVLEEQAKLFVKDAIAITPPNQDYKIQRKLGEAAVMADIKKIMRGVRDGAQVGITDPSALHQKYRRKNTGRVEVVKAFKDKFPVVGLQAYIKKVQARVGILASGWNAAAHKLGVKVPDWISRHGNSGGRISVKFGIAESRITIINAIKFAGGVKGLVRRVQAALEKRTGAMNRRLEHYQREGARKAGFK